MDMPPEPGRPPLSGLPQCAGIFFPLELLLSSFLSFFSFEIISFFFLTGGA